MSQVSVINKEIFVYNHVGLWHFFVMKKTLQSLPYNLRSLLCFAVGVLGVLGVTWIIEQIIGPEFPGWLGILLNGVSFALSGLGFYYGIRAAWQDMHLHPQWVVITSRVSALSLLGLVLNGFWFLLYSVLVVPMLISYLR